MMAHEKASMCTNFIWLPSFTCSILVPTNILTKPQSKTNMQRLAMLAAAGWPLSELFDKKLASALHLTPIVDDANRAPALLNGGLGKVSPAYWAAVLLLASAVDAYGLTKVNDQDYTPGDLKFDPLRLKKINPQWMETAEIKNGRLAMIAITGFAVQEFVSGNAAFAAL